MSWTHIQGGSVGSSGAQATLTATLTGVTVGHLLCVGYSIAGNFAGSLSDGSNTYTNRKNQALGAGNYEIAIYTAPVTTGGTLSLVLTPDGGTAKFCSLVWDEYSYTPGATLSLDGTVGSAGTTSPASGNLSITTPDLCYAIACANGQGFTSTVGGGFTLRNNVAYSAGTTISIVNSDYVNAGSSPVDATFTLAGTTTAWECIAIGMLATGGGVSYTPWIYGDQIQDIFG